MKRKLLVPLLVLLAVLGVVSGCMDYGASRPERVGGSKRGLFITNEGNFMYGNASLSYYNIDSMRVENDVFRRTNTIKLGDVAQSMVIRNGLGYVVVNNSGVIFVIDVNTFELKGMIKGLLSPRYIHFLSDEKAYVTDLYAWHISIINPKTFELTGRINVKIPGKNQPSTEQMVQYGDYVFTNCWSYDNKILMIDTRADTVAGYIEVGKQPTSLALDKYGKIWTVTDGGYPGSPYGQEAPGLYRIDAATRRVDQVFMFEFGERASEVCLNGTRDTLYYINKHVWRMDVRTESLPEKPFLENTTGNFWYGLTIDPKTSEVYLADALDYTQRGWIFRYSAKGDLLDSFQVGVIPGAFCFK